MDEIWSTIVQQALGRELETTDGAVPGAKLRQAIARIAAQRGLKYPPAGNENEKFGDFLKRFASQLLVLRREGQDLLVAPVDKPDLLDRPGDSTAHLRDDIFEAFTRIPRGSQILQPWYVRDSDRIEWLAAAEKPDQSRFVRIPPASLDEELKDREAFARSLQIQKEVQDRLLASLGVHSALESFSAAIRDHGLGRKWHLHRLRSIVGRIKHWCETANVLWRDEWISGNGIQGVGPCQKSSLPPWGSSWGIAGPHSLEL